MRNIESFSYALEDVFSLYLTDFRPGFFVDVGCGHPRNGNNSKLLEAAGWTGICIDSSKHSEWDHDRATTCHALDATKVDYSELFRRQNAPAVIDMLSIDVDDACFEVLKEIPFDDREYKIVMIEHDVYRTDHLRLAERSCLAAKGYELLCSDVVHEPGKPFEDWWVMAKHFDQALLDRVRSDGEIDITIIRRFRFNNRITRQYGFSGRYPQIEVA
jgi:hypothetical protein